MSTSRRSLIAALGLAPATAVGATAFIEPPIVAGELTSGAGSYEKERYARAFESLANEIRRDGVSICSLHFSSQLRPDAIADEHAIELRLYYHPDA